MPYLESRRTRSKVENKQLIQGIAIMFILAFIAAGVILAGIVG